MGTNWNIYQTLNLQSAHVMVNANKICHLQVKTKCLFAIQASFIADTVRRKVLRDRQKYFVWADGITIQMKERKLPNAYMLCCHSNAWGLYYII